MMDGPGLLFRSFLGYHCLLKASRVCSPAGSRVPAPKKPAKWVHWNFMNFMENESQWVLNKSCSRWGLGFSVVSNDVFTHCLWNLVL